MCNRPDAGPQELDRAFGPIVASHRSRVAVGERDGKHQTGQQANGGDGAYRSCAPLFREYAGPCSAAIWVADSALKSATVSMPSAIEMGICVMKKIPPNFRNEARNPPCAEG